jgi:hypothetical protein
LFFRRQESRNKSRKPVVLPRANPHKTQEFIMKKIAFAALSSVAFVVLAASSSAFADGKTRAQVYQELIEAQQNGLNYVTDTSYPEVNPVFARQVEQHKEALAVQAATASRVASGSTAGSTAGSTTGSSN